MRVPDPSSSRGRGAAVRAARSRAPLPGLLLVLLPGALVWVAGLARADVASDGPAGPDAAELIARMSEAMRTLDYEGTFVHSARGHLSSMRILHSSDDGGALERLTALDGERREVIRDHEHVTCIWPATSVVSVTEAKLRGGLPEVDAGLADNASYTLVRGAPGRVAGLPAETVHIEPVDALRYGYRFWIDAATHMLLRSMLVDEADRVLEEVLFTHIDYPESIDPARFAVPDGARSASLPTRADAPDAAATPERPDRVGFDALPAGYAELDEHFSAMPVEGGPVSHVMVSDGVASVSVYVEHVPPAEQDLSLAGMSSIGAVSAYGRSLPQGFVTVVGEVPAATVRLVADAVTLR